MSLAPEQQQALRGKLKDRARELMGREEALSKHLRGADGRLDADFGDIANFTGNDEVLESLEDAALLELKGIQGALERMNDGSYGTCISCGDDIQAKRLEVLPHATRCTTCAAAAES